MHVSALPAERARERASVVERAADKHVAHAGRRATASIGRDGGRQGLAGCGRRDGNRWPTDGILWALSFAANGSRGPTSLADPDDAPRGAGLLPSFPLLHMTWVPWLGLQPISQPSAPFKIRSTRRCPNCLFLQPSPFFPQT